MERYFSVMTESGGSKSSAVLVQGSPQEADRYNRSRQQSAESRSTSKQNSDGRLNSADVGTVERRANSVDRREKSSSNLLAGEKVDSSAKRHDRKKDVVAVDSGDGKSDGKKGAVSTTAITYDNSTPSRRDREDDQVTQSSSTSKAAAEIAVQRDSVHIAEQSRSNRDGASQPKASPLVKRELSNDRALARVKTGDIISLLDAGKVMRYELLDRMINDYWAFLIID